MVLNQSPRPPWSTNKLLTVGTVLLVFGWLFTWWPPRNVYGNPSSEDLEGTCRFPGARGAVVRLYVGGGGATEPEYFSVTIQPWYLPIDRQFYFAYATPRIDAVRCTADSTIALLDRDSAQPIQQVPLRIIARTLVFSPLYYDRGKQDNRLGWVYYSYVSELFGFALIVGGVAMLALIIRREVAASRKPRTRWTLP